MAASSSAMGVSAETAEEVDPEKEVWAVPPAYLRRPTLQPRECRKMAGGLANIVRSEQVTKSDEVGAWIQDTHYSYKQAAPMAVGNNSRLASSGTMALEPRFQILGRELL